MRSRSGAVAVTLLLIALVPLSGPLLSRGLPAIVGYAGQAADGPFLLERDAYTGDLHDLPIGVFDSGVGGLTVLEAILALDEFDNTTGAAGGDGRPDFEHEHFIYLGDQANMPYGYYPSEGKTDFLRELAVKDALFMLGRRYWPEQDASAPKFDKPPVKAIVIACNTATAYGFDDIQAALGQWGLPVYLVGVVNAGARGALAATGGRGAVAVMATVGTCASEGYVRAVDAAWRDAGLDAPPVIQQGCLGLAGAIEGDHSFLGATPETYKGPSPQNPEATIEQPLMSCYGFEPAGIIAVGDTSLMLNSVENYIRFHTLTLVEKYDQTSESSRPPQPISGVILGCTHFPFYSSSLQAAFGRLRNLEVDSGGKTVRPYAGLLAAEIKFINPAKNTAAELYAELRERGLLLAGGESGVSATDEFYISVPALSLPGGQYDDKGAFAYAYKYGRQPGNFGVEYVRRMPMTAASLSAEAAEMVRGKLPLTWARLVEFNASCTKLAALPGKERLN